MIKNTDILYAVNLILDTKFGYESFVEEQGEEVKVPTFFIQLSPLSSNSFLRYNEKLTNIVITYVDKVITQESLLDIQNDLDDLFDMYIQVGTRKIMIDKKKFNVTKDFLTMTLTLDYLDNKSSLPKNEQSTDKMGELNINE
jgi:hypothetical protein